MMEKKTMNTIKNEKPDVEKWWESMKTIRT